MARTSRRGAALLFALVAIVVVGSSLSMAHRLSLNILRQGRAALAATRAREAAASGIATVSLGGPRSGVLPGGSWWTVVDDSLASGERILWSHGATRHPSPAGLEVGTLLSAPDSVLGARPVRWWVVMRR